MSSDKDKTKRIIKQTVIALSATYMVLNLVAKAKKRDSVYADEPDQQNPMEGKSVIFTEDESDPENADGKKGHLTATGESKTSTRHQSFYERCVKRTIDKTISFAGLVLLSPVMASIALAIKIEDPGPVIFTQKRVGLDKQYFKLHKFRSMKMSTPHDVPTHMLENPEQYITKVGGFIRKHSLDELPQIWDIFVGNMSVIGPRPALWNQDLLTAERDKYGANDVKPGLTGWAQINGRDELEIPEKAKLDGVYTEALEKGGAAALKMDLKCFTGSLHVFGNDDTVVEGGTGELSREAGEHSGEGKLREGVPETDPEEHFACDYHFDVDHTSHKNVLIVGKNSYIGDSFISYANEHYGDNFTFTVVDTLPGSDGRSELDALSSDDLAAFDIVYHLAGIAHADVGNVDDATKEKYYKVNTDLAVATAKRYKEAHSVAGREGLFVFMSSMIVYGDSAPYGKEKVVDRNTTPTPANFYGDSKWQADKGIRSLADETMNVAIIRPPMIYGKGSKGNYPTLAELAKKLPVFPDVSNSRSMLYVGNLCEFLSQMFLSKVSSVDGEDSSEAPNALIFMPQNGEYTKTADMVKAIAETVSHHISVVKVLNPAVVLADKVPGKVSRLVDKAFGNNCYDQKLSVYNGLDYQKYTLKESIERTEGANAVVNSSSSNTDTAEHSNTPIKFSIITVCRNSGESIRKTIESVLSQAYPNVEYFIIDGASTDGTADIAHEYDNQFKAKGYSYIITSEPDHGIYDAMNKGIRKSTGDLVGIINAGDWYEPDALSTVADSYTQTHFDYFFADINLIKQDGTKIVKHSKVDKHPTSHHWNHPTSFVTKKTYYELGVFKCEGIHDDFDFYLRIRKAGKRIVVENKVLANFVTGGASNTKSLDKSIKRIRDRYKCYKDNGYSPAFLAECVAIEAVKFVLS